MAQADGEAWDGFVPVTAPGLLAPADAQTRPFRTIALIIAVAWFMDHLDATVLATALPTMARDFGVRATDMSIALTSYLLALAIFIPASGAIADRYGSRRLFQAAIGLFLLGSAGCGLSTALPMIVLARFVQGIGGAMMIPVGRLILLRSVDKRDLVAATSWLIMPALIGPIIGPPIGGLIVTYLSWHWIFWINMPVGLAGILLVRRFIPDFRADALGSFDRRGFVLAAVFLGAVLFGFELASRDKPWLALVLVVSGLASGALCIQHARRTKHPILQFRLLGVPTFRISFVAGSLTRITQGALPFLLPLFTQLGMGMSPAQSGFMTFAPAAGSFLMKPLAKPIINRLGFRKSLIGGSVLASIGYAACSLVGDQWPPLIVFALFAAAGFAMSFVFTGYNTIAYADIPDEQISAATSFYATFQQLTLSLGICAAALLLHISSSFHGTRNPTHADFGMAFLAVAAVSVIAIFANARLDPSAGDKLIA